MEIRTRLFNDRWYWNLAWPSDKSKKKISSLMIHLISLLIPKLRSCAGMRHTSDHSWESRDTNTTQSGEISLFGCSKCLVQTSTGLRVHRREMRGGLIKILWRVKRFVRVGFFGRKTSSLWSYCFEDFGSCNIRELRQVEPWRKSRNLPMPQMSAGACCWYPCCKCLIAYSRIRALSAASSGSCPPFLSAAIEAVH